MSSSTTSSPTRKPSRRCPRCPHRLSDLSNHGENFPSVDERLGKVVPSSPLLSHDGPVQVQAGSASRPSQLAKSTNTYLLGDPKYIDDSDIYDADEVRLRGGQGNTRDQGEHDGTKSEPEKSKERVRAPKETLHAVMCVVASGPVNEKGSVRVNEGAHARLETLEEMMFACSKDSKNSSAVSDVDEGISVESEELEDFVDSDLDDTNNTAKLTREELEAELDDLLYCIPREVDSAVDEPSSSKSSNKELKPERSSFRSTGKESQERRDSLLKKVRFEMEDRWGRMTIVERQRVDWPTSEGFGAQDKCVERLAKGSCNCKDFNKGFKIGDADYYRHGNDHIGKSIKLDHWSKLRKMKSDEGEVLKSPSGSLEDLMFSDKPSET